MTLTTSNMTADTESGQCIFLSHSLLKLRLTEESTAFMYSFQNKFRIRKTFQIKLLFVTAQSATHSKLS